MKTSSAENQEEAQWLRRCRNGDREAFAALIERYQRWIHAHLYRWVGHQERAEEMTQEVFLKAYSQISQFRDEAKVSTWLFQIALNLARDEWRTKARRAAAGETAGVEALRSEILLQDRHMENRQNAQALHAALAGLPDIYRETLLLRYFSELSLGEIGEVQGQGLSNVKMRIARGLGHLRKKMEEISNES